MRDIREGGGEAEVQGADPARRQGGGRVLRGGAREGDRGDPAGGGQHAGAHPKRYYSL